MPTCTDMHITLRGQTLCETEAHSQIEHVPLHINFLQLARLCTYMIVFTDETTVHSNSAGLTHT